MVITDQITSELEQAFQNCMKCGFCKMSCPLFLGEETTSPRAKVRLARALAAGDVSLSPILKRVSDRCLNCKACAAECPSGVEPHRVAIALRHAFVERDGLPFIKRLIFRTGLNNPRLMALGSKALGLAQRVSLINRQANPLRSVLPVLGMRKDKDLPMMGRRSLMAMLSETIDPVGELKTTVIYFPGCAANFLYPEIGLATVSVLRKLGARVILPHDLVCCSTPVFSSGDIEGARRLAEQNIRILSSIEADNIITSCGSCGLTIKREWSEQLGLTGCEGISAKLMDISQFVASHVSDSALIPLEDDETVTYHDSCHLRRGMGVYKEPRMLLSAILGDRFVEMESPDRCCGGSGAFSIYQPELSQIVAETKINCIRESGAGAVASGCPACMMQLRDSITHRNMPQQAIHTIQIIDRALKAG